MKKRKSKKQCIHEPKYPVQIYLGGKFPKIYCKSCKVQIKEIPVLAWMEVSK